MSDWNWKVIFKRKKLKMDTLASFRSKNLGARYHNILRLKFDTMLPPLSIEYKGDCWQSWTNTYINKYGKSLGLHIGASII